MISFIPFKAYRPTVGKVTEVASLPYDVFTREEAREYVKDKPLSFLNIDRPETQFSEEADMYGEAVYIKAREMLEAWIKEGIFIEEKKEAYYIYEQVLILNGSSRTQTGVVGLSSVDDYRKGIIKKHENTVEAKEQDRIRHIDTCNAQTGPIFLCYKYKPEISAFVSALKEKQAPVYSIKSSKPETYSKIWVISKEDDVKKLFSFFATVPYTYIADGHHRAASAVKVALKRNPVIYDDTKECNHFLSVLFPDNELEILSYNRLIRDLGGLSENQIIEKLSEDFVVTKLESKILTYPQEKKSYNIFLKGTCYNLKVKDSVFIRRKNDEVAVLDVSIVQDLILDKIFGIKNPRTDNRITFVGGIKPVSYLQVEAEKISGLGLAMSPTSIEELLAVADAGRLMPPKSTWFEPKLLSGLFIHKI